MLFANSLLSNFNTTGAFPVTFILVPSASFSIISVFFSVLTRCADILFAMILWVALLTAVILSTEEDALLVLSIRTVSLLLKTLSPPLI